MHELKGKAFAIRDAIGESCGLNCNTVSNRFDEHTKGDDNYKNDRQIVENGKCQSIRILFPHSLHHIGAVVSKEKGRGKKAGSVTSKDLGKVKQELMDISLCVIFPQLILLFVNQISMTTIGQFFLIQHFTIRVGWKIL